MHNTSRAALTVASCLLFCVAEAQFLQIYKYCPSTRAEPYLYTMVPLGNVLTVIGCLGSLVMVLHFVMP